MLWEAITHFCVCAMGGDNSCAMGGDNSCAMGGDNSCAMGGDNSLLYLCRRRKTARNSRMEISTSITINTVIGRLSVSTGWTDKAKEMKIKV